MQESTFKIMNYKKVPNIKVMKGLMEHNLQVWLRISLNSARRKKLICGSILLCNIVRDLTGGGSVAVADGVSDMSQVTGDTRD